MTDKPEQPGKNQEPSEYSKNFETNTKLYILIGSLIALGVKLYLHYA